MSDLLYKQADSEWSTSRNWYNNRVMDTFISSPIVDKQGDMIPTETLKESMNFYMKYGIYAYKHDEIPIGQPLAWRIKDGKVLLKVGIHNKLDMHDKIWKEIQEFGSKGASSIRGEALSQNQVCPPGESCFTKIDKLGLWSVSWVGDSPANPEATVQTVSMAKQDENIGSNVSENELESNSHIKKCGECSKPVEKCGDCKKPVQKRPVDPRERMRYAKYIQATGVETQSLARDLDDKYKRYVKVKDACQKSMLDFNKAYPQPLDFEAKKLREYVEQCLHDATQMLITMRDVMKQGENLDRMLEVTYLKANPKVRY